MKKKISIAIVAVILVLCVASAVIVPSILAHSSDTAKDETTEQLAEVDTEIEDSEDNKEVTTVDKAETSEASTEQIIETADNTVAGSSNTNQNKTETSKANTGATGTANNTEKSNTNSTANAPKTESKNEATHTHNWVKVVDVKAYDEYEEVPVYEMQEVTDLDNWTTHYFMRDGQDIAYWTGDQKSAWDRQHCTDCFPDAPDPRYADGHAVCASAVKIETIYATKTEQVQVGTEQKLVAHHDEVSHYECSCGAVK